MQISRPPERGVCCGAEPASGDSGAGAAPTAAAAAQRKSLEPSLERRGASVIAAAFPEGVHLRDNRLHYSLLTADLGSKGSDLTQPEMETQQTA